MVLVGWKKTLPIWIAFLLFVISGTGCSRSGSSVPAITVPAPELTGSHDWINTSTPLKLSDLKGKVVLLDFWNLSCVNCFHTMPILKKLEEQYKNDLVIIGIHSPKYSSEKDTNPLRDAVKRLEITHPVVNDSESEIWSAYGVKAYPTLVLIDPNGRLVKMIVGERTYQQLDKLVEGMIKEFRAENRLNEKPLAMTLDATSSSTSPLCFPEKLCIDPKRKVLFIADSGHNRIVAVDLNGNVQFTIGNGIAGFKDGTFEQSEFHHPRGLIVQGENLYVADTENQRIRNVDLNQKLVSTISGDGQLTDILAPADLGKARAARLNSPWDLAFANNKLYITMAGSHQLYDLDFASGKLFVFAGSGDEELHDGPLLEADLAQPSGIAYDAGKLYFTDSETNSVRVADTSTKVGAVKTITGKGLMDYGDTDGSLSEAFLQHPLGLAARDQKIFVADTLNHKVKAIDLKTNMVSTVWGSGKPGDAIGDYPQFNEPNGLALYNDNLYIADTNNNEIKVGNLSTGKVTTLRIKGLAPPAAVNHNNRLN